MIHQKKVIYKIPLKRYLGAFFDLNYLNNMQKTGLIPFSRYHFEI